MSPKEWRQLKEELLSRNLVVRTIGRQRKEYLASTEYMNVDILRGGMIHSGQSIEVFVYDASIENIAFHDSFRTIQDVLKVIDGYIADYQEFGSIC